MRDLILPFTGVSLNLRVSPRVPSFPLTVGVPTHCPWAARDQPTVSSDANRSAPGDIY